MLSPNPRTKSHPSRWHTLLMACATWVCSMPPSPISPSATNFTSVRSGSRGCSLEKRASGETGCKHPVEKNNKRKHSTAQEKPCAFTVFPIGQVAQGTFHTASQYSSTANRGHAHHPSRDAQAQARDARAVTGGRERLV